MLHLSDDVAQARRVPRPCRPLAAADGGARVLRLEEDEKLVLTPFEKNIEVWRQLWRVLERSDIIVQVRLVN